MDLFITERKNSVGPGYSICERMEFRTQWFAQLSWSSIKNGALQSTIYSDK